LPPEGGAPERRSTCQETDSGGENVGKGAKIDEAAKDDQLGKKEQGGDRASFIEQKRDVRPSEGKRMDRDDESVFWGTPETEAHKRAPLRKGVSQRIKKGGWDLP